ncbi:hypothetical protein HLB44_17700 [Aquincola sp. S2]|uniref:Glycine zipper family protein n=1 Tax=Pseudaquabacterium terrae TaxID=2732868 RepID=A0ABX2EJR9_9BURK|nr:hypothetical protein [Aquabacterium terrae]NRF68830.1 hypothetical protein [Aquabacterium terrae]
MTHLLRGLAWLLAGLLVSTGAFAGGGHGGHRHGHHGHWHGHRHHSIGLQWHIGYPYYPYRYGWYAHTLPAVYTAVVIGGITYYHAQGVYYRVRDDGAYDIVPAPTQEPAQPAPARQYTYPRQGQSSAQQASDDYECHRWAASQSGFDPSASATGQGSGDAARRADYARARSACLEGRGYTVR